MTVAVNSVFGFEKDWLKERDRFDANARNGQIENLALDFFDRSRLKSWLGRERVRIKREELNTVVGHSDIFVRPDRVMAVA